MLFILYHSEIHSGRVYGPLTATAFVYRAPILRENLIFGHSGEEAGFEILRKKKSECH